MAVPRSRRTFSQSFTDALDGERPRTRAGWIGRVLGATIGRVFVGAQYAVGVCVVLDLWGAI